MAGLIQNQMPAAPQPQQPSQGGALPSPDQMLAQMHVTPQQKPQLARIVVAGMKIMFDPKTHQMMLNQLKGQGPMAQKLGMGIAGLMGLLMKESNNSLPPALIIPAAIVLAAHAADFLNKAGAQLAPQDFGQAVEILVTTILKQFKIDPSQVQQIAGDAEQAAGAQGGQPAPQPQGAQ